MSKMTNMGIALNYSNPGDYFDAVAAQQDRIVKKMPDTDTDGYTSDSYTSKAPSLLRYGSKRFHHELWQCLKFEYLQTDLNEFVDEDNNRKNGLNRYRVLEDNFNRPVSWWRQHSHGYLDREFKNYTRGERGLYSHADVGTYGPLMRRIRVGSKLYKKIKFFGVLRPIQQPMSFHDWFTLKFNVPGYYHENDFIYFLGTQQKFIDAAD